MRLSQSLDLLEGIASNWVSQILFGILEPRIESGSFLGESEIELLDLLVLLLHLEEFVPSGIRAMQQILPSMHHICVSLLDRRCLLVSSVDQLTLQLRDSLDSLVFECIESRIEGFLLRQQNLHSRQVFAIVVRSDLLLLLRDPTLHNIAFPDKLQVSGVVSEPLQTSSGQVFDVSEPVAQLLASRLDVSIVVISVSDQLVASVADVGHLLLVQLQVDFECVVLLQQSLHSSHVVAEILRAENLLLLVHPGFFFLDISQELLERLGLVESLMSVASQVPDLSPAVLEIVHSLLDVLLGNASGLGGPQQFSSLLLDESDSWFVAGEFGVNTTMLATKILDSRQISSIVVGRDEEFLLLDPGLLVVDVAEELVHIQSLVQLVSAVLGHLLHAVVSVGDRLASLGNSLSLELIALQQRVGLLLHFVDSVLVSGDVCLDQLLLLQEILHGGQVLSIVVRSEQNFDFSQPELEILHGSHEALLFVGFFQLDRLISSGLDKQLPLIVERIESGPDCILASLALGLVDEFLSGADQRLDSVRVRGELGLEGLLLLVLLLDVGRVTVVLFGSNLELLGEPGLDLIGISGELLKRLALSQLASLLDQGRLQSFPSVQNLVSLPGDGILVVVIAVDELLGELLEGGHFLLLIVDRFVEVFMFLDERLHVVASRVFLSEECLSSAHPVVCLKFWRVYKRK